MWFDIIKNNPYQEVGSPEYNSVSEQVKNANSFQELFDIVKEGNIWGSNKKVYSPAKFNWASERLLEHWKGISMMDNQPDFIQKVNDMFRMSTGFTSRNDLREKFLMLLLDKLEKKFPSKMQLWGSEQATRDFIRMGTAGIIDLFTPREDFERENR
jgi:hypothetical protein